MDPDPAVVVHRNYGCINTSLNSSKLIPKRNFYMNSSVLIKINSHIMEGKWLQSVKGRSYIIQ